MAENLFTFLFWGLAAGHATGEWPRAGGELFTGGSARYRIYATSDGRHLAVAPLEDKFWDAFCEAISKHLDASPTFSSFVFAPVPTITAIGKGAIVTGQYPSACSSDIAADMCRCYQLNARQLIVAANWDDALRVRVLPRAKERLNTPG